MDIRKIWIVVDEERYYIDKRNLEIKLTIEGIHTKCISKLDFLEKTKDDEMLPIHEFVLTDCGEVCQHVLQKKGTVAVFLHENNKNSDFSGVQYFVESLCNLTFSYFQRVYERIVGKPWKILETKRCILREMQEEDAETFLELYSEPLISAFLSPASFQLEEEKKYIREYRKFVYNFYEFGIWTILLKDTGSIIGRAGIEWKDHEEVPEMGYMIGSEWQRQGYAYEVCSAILDYAREELEMCKLRAYVSKENVASLNLCKKLGFSISEFPHSKKCEKNKETEKDVCLEWYL